MDDVTVVSCNPSAALKEDNNNKVMAIGVFDGHGGQEVARMAGAQLIQILEHNVEFKVEIESLNSLKHEIDKQINSPSSSSRASSVSNNPEELDEHTLQQQTPENNMEEDSSSRSVSNSSSSSSDSVISDSNEELEILTSAQQQRTTNKQRNILIGTSSLCIVSTIVLCCAAFLSEKINDIDGLKETFISLGSIAFLGFIVSAAFAFSKPSKTTTITSVEEPLVDANHCVQK